jgi:hypothetical protein
MNDGPGVQDDKEENMDHLSTDDAIDATRGGQPHFPALDGSGMHIEEFPEEGSAGDDAYDLIDDEMYDDEDDY